MGLGEWGEGAERSEAREAAAGGFGGAAAFLPSFYEKAGCRGGIVLVGRQAGIFGRFNRGISKAASSVDGAEAARFEQAFFCKEGKT